MSSDFFFILQTIFFVEIFEQQFSDKSDDSTNHLKYAQYSSKVSKSKIVHQFKIPKFYGSDIFNSINLNN